MSNTDIQKQIGEWANNTFGALTSNCKMAIRANEEMAELLTELAKDDNSKNAKFECADIVICLYRLADNMGFSLNDAISEKMELNYKNEFHSDGCGTGYHKHDSQ
jgi:hypothetical protein